MRTGKSPYDLIFLDTQWTIEFYEGGFLAPLKEIDASFDLDAPYLVTDTIEVQGEDETAVLTLLPGVQLLFREDEMLRVGYGAPGALTADGTGGGRVVFTTAGTQIPGTWGGLAAGVFGSKALGGMGGVSLASQAVGTLLGIVIAVMGAGLVYGVIRAVTPLRLDPDEEFNGADLSIHKISATPE